MELSVSEPMTQEYIDYKAIYQVYLVKHIDDELYHLSKLEVCNQQTLDRMLRIMEYLMIYTKDNVYVLMMI